MRRTHSGSTLGKVLPIQQASCRKQALARTWQRLHRLVHRAVHRSCEQSVAALVLGMHA
jgi:hypothetical protein